MPENVQAAPEVPAAAQEEDVVEVLAEAGKKVRVKRRTLLLSPVIRQMLEAQVGEGDDRKPIAAGPNIEIKASAAAIKWLFGLIEGKSFTELGIPEAKDLEKPPPTKPIHDARNLADVYDIPFFDPILTEAMWKLASMGTYYAVTALGVGYSMANQSLCRFAVSNMTGLAIPHKLSYSSFDTMGSGAAPVFRDAFGIQSIGDQREALKDQRIEIDASAKGVRWLFGLLEGSTLEALGAGPEQFRRSTDFDPQPVHEARALADRYDIPSFDGVLVQAMLELARWGKRSAATALGIAYAMHDQALCEFAASRLEPHEERPHTLSQKFANAIGHGASGALAMAYLNLILRKLASNKMPGSGETLPHDEDYIDVRVDSGETVRVRRRTLLLSPVIRDAFSIQSKSNVKSLSAGSKAQEESTSSTDAPIELGGSADALNWLIGLLEATPLKELGMSAEDAISAPPSIRPLQEAIELADKLDIPFYKNLVLQAMYSLAKQGKYQAISAYNIGCALGDIDLARSAVVAMVGLPTPLEFSRTELQDMNTATVTEGTGMELKPSGMNWPPRSSSKIDLDLVRSPVWAEAARQGVKYGYDREGLRCCSISY
ncbi:hypothetical protein FFLO_04586 [Filobasidium floriforme]|uniref:Uncharacterized protein n=1 Tax=Filobasidium floriforme TaxID=5210 RepID=A0A8K0NP47_9TREE|nr:uncharacterized protein HD553DRAFT_351623 [Filobasidium floriforme]KAG7531092.1 hypothetical protein FFLO_04586 [Filobasidium floriforme]KAH8081534.1 hypothetical protein HD553DRAFT_351623 [Filobasidium floriforme]